MAESLGFGFYAFSGVVFGIGFESHWHEFNKSKDVYLDGLIERLSSIVYHDSKKKIRGTHRRNKA